MKTKKVASQKIGATPGKLSLVAVLAILFVWVVWNEFSGDKSETVPLADRSDDSMETIAVSAEASVATPAPMAPSMTVRDEGARFPSPPVYDLEKVTKHDPFCFPADWKRVISPVEESQIVEGDKQETKEDKAKQVDFAAVDELKKRGADMIIISGSQRLAIIGNETLEIGDVYEGLRVVSIESNGLTVERIE